MKEYNYTATADKLEPLFLKMRKKEARDRWIMDWARTEWIKRKMPLDIWDDFSDRDNFIEDMYLKIPEKEKENLLAYLTNVK